MNSGLTPRRTRRIDRVGGAVLAVHLVAALALRTVAWPEVTTPAYLWSRGMVMYRDIKFVHTPGMIGLLALAFAGLGVSTAVVRIFALVWPLVAHVFVLSETRRLSLATRLASSAFFLALLFDWQGTSIWPTVMIAALAVPIAKALGRNRVVAAGLWIGCAILIKQTAAYLLAVVLIRLLWDRKVRDAMKLTGAAAAPYLLCGLGFALAGAGPDYFRWTLVVPFRIRNLISEAPSAGSAWLAVCAFLPAALQAWIEKPGDYETGTRDYLLVAFGLALMAFPRFGFIQMVGAIPCLTIGAARFLQSSRGLLRAFSFGLVLTLALSVGAIVLAGEPLNGRVLFWNHDDAFNELVQRVRRLPPSTPLESELWDNLLPRSGLLPPGRIYVNPLLGRQFGLNDIDSVGERVRHAASASGVVTVKSGSEGLLRGPYTLLTNPNP